MLQVKDPQVAIDTKKNLDKVRRLVDCAIASKFEYGEFLLIDHGAEDFAGEEIWRRWPMKLCNSRGLVKSGGYKGGKGDNKGGAQHEQRSGRSTYVSDLSNIGGGMRDLRIPSPAPQGDAAISSGGRSTSQAPGTGEHGRGRLSRNQSQEHSRERSGVSKDGIRSSRAPDRSASRDSNRSSSRGRSDTAASAINDRKDKRSGPSPSKKMKFG